MPKGPTREAHGVPKGPTRGAHGVPKGPTQGGPRGAQGAHDNNRGKSNMCQKIGLQNYWVGGWGSDPFRPITK